MAKVTGIGGIFFKSEDPKTLRAWYRAHLGLELSDWGGYSFYWRDLFDGDRIGRTEWGPFEADTDYFAPSEAPFMFNFRVDDLDGMLEQLRERGATIVGDVEAHEYGRFAWVLDCEGHKIELWEPAGEEGQRVDT